MADLLSQKPSISRSADEVAAFLVRSFKSSIRGYLLSTPLFLVLLLTDKWQVKDPASAILDVMPLIWLVTIGAHCLLYLLLEKRVSSPKVIASSAPVSIREPLTVITVTPDEMTRILECVLNKNAAAELPSEPMPTFPYAPVVGGEGPKAFLLSKYRTVVTTMPDFGPVPVCVESDACLLIELKSVIGQWNREEALRLYHRSAAVPVNIRFVLQDSPAATWPIPFDQPWGQPALETLPSL